MIIQCATICAIVNLSGLRGKSLTLLIDCTLLCTVINTEWLFMTTIWQCPVCGLPLLRDQRRYHCTANHSFDVAKEGYVNLLLANQKSSQSPGDSAAMIQHRRAWLQRGHYALLAETVAATVAEHICTDENTLPVLDVGCGEGYYTGHVQQNLPCAADVYGVDISKVAVKRAAKTYQDSHFAVGSVAQLPVRDASVGCLLNIFAPHDAAEFARVMSDDAPLFVVTPAEGHLRQLREMIYDEVRPYQSSLADDLAPHFAPTAREEIAYTITLDSSDAIADLFKMTPFYWTTPAEKQAVILALSSLTLDIAFAVDVFQQRT